MRWKGMLAAVAAIGALGGCGGDGQGAATVRVYASERLGAGNVVRAYQLALRDAGSRAGAYKVELVALDDEEPREGRPTPEKVRANARRAAADDRAVAYLGDAGSGETVLSAPITNRAGLLHVCADCSYTGLTRPTADPSEPGKYRPTGRRTFGRPFPTDAVQSAALVAYVKREGLQRITVARDDRAYGIGLAAEVARRAREAGLTLVEPPHLYRPLEQEGRTARRLGAQAIIFAGQYFPLHVFDRVARAAPGAVLFTGDSFASPEAAKENPEAAGRLRITAPKPPDARSALVRGFARRFEDLYGTRPNIEDLYAYEAMRLVLSSIERAGARGGDRAAVVRAFFATPRHRSVVGTYGIDEAGDTTARSYGAYGFEDGELVFRGVLRTP